MAAARLGQASIWSLGRQGQPYIPVSAVDEAVPQAASAASVPARLCPNACPQPRSRIPPQKFSEDRSRQRQESAMEVLRRSQAEQGFGQLEVPDAAEAPLRQTRVCLVGLLVLAGLRGWAVNVYTSLTGLAWTAHMLSCAADVVATLGSFPVFVNCLIGTCMHRRCLGSLLTLLLTTTVCDAGAAMIFISSEGAARRFMGPEAASEGAPANVAFITVWECILLSSISLEVTLCFSAWQFYRAFREAGLYPPNADCARLHKEVSPLEFLCEAEDVALLSDQCNACQRDWADSRSDDIVKAPDMPANHRGEAELDGYGFSEGIGMSEFDRVALAARDQELRRL